MYLTPKAYPKRAVRTANRAFLSALCLTVLFLSAIPVHAQRFVKVVNTIDELVRLNPSDVHTNVFVADPNRGGLFTLAPRGTTNSGTVFASTNALRQWNRQDASGEFNVRWFGAVGNGTTDDNAAVQATITAAIAAGGEVVVPDGVYNVRSLVVASRKPLTIRGLSYGYHHLGQSIPCLALGGATTNMITVQSPTGTRDDGGGVVIKGLSFQDLTRTSSFTQGTNSISGAVIYLKDGNMSLIENCVIEGFTGTAIKTEFTVSSKILTSVIRFNGTASKPVIDVSETDDTYTTQGLLIEGNVLEVNHGEYIRVRAVGDVKIGRNQFEAETSIGSASKYFIHDESRATDIYLNTFNRNTNIQVFLAGSAFKTLVTGNTFSGGVNAVEGLRLGGIFATVEANRFNSGKTANEILESGTYNRVIANTFVNSGGVTSTGTGFAFDYNTWFAESVFCTNAYVINLGANSTSCSGNTLDGPASGTGGGILVSSNSTLTKVHGNWVKDFGGIGIRIETSLPSVKGNVAFQNAGGNFSSIHAAETILDNYFDGEPWLEARATWNPPALASGQLRSVDVTVVGAALGDVAEASFGTPQNGNYLMPANVIGIDTVRVFLWNLQNSASDFASGDLHVRVRKRSAVAIYGTVTDNANESPIFALQGAVDAKQDAFTTGPTLTNISGVLDAKYVPGTNVVFVTNSTTVSINVGTNGAAVTDTDGYIELPTVTTTDSTATPIFTNTPAINTVTIIHADIYAIENGAGNAMVRSVNILFLDDGGSLSAVMSDPTANQANLGTEAPTYDVTASIVGGTTGKVFVDNNGAVADVKWKMRYRIQTHSF